MARGMLIEQGCVERCEISGGGEIQQVTAYAPTPACSAIRLVP